MNWITYVGIDVAKAKLDIAIKITEKGQAASLLEHCRRYFSDERPDLSPL